jgi:hypothetical protein
LNIEIGNEFLQELHTIETNYQRRTKIANDKYKRSVENFNGMYDGADKAALDTLIVSRA